jgi:hypothetical protein
VVDTNCDPDLIQYVIPGNDDAIRAGNLMCRIISDAVEEGRHIASRRHAKAVANTPKPSADNLDPEVEARRLHQQAEARRQAALQAQEREARLAATRRHQQATDIAPPGDDMPAATLTALAEHGATNDNSGMRVVSPDDEESSDVRQVGSDGEMVSTLAPAAADAAETATPAAPAATVDPAAPAAETPAPAAETPAPAAETAAAETAAPAAAPSDAGGA